MTRSIYYQIIPWLPLIIWGLYLLIEIRKRGVIESIHIFVTRFQMFSRQLFQEFINQCSKRKSN